MVTKPVMKLIDPHTGRMVCKVCGSEHFASIKPGSNGKFHYGAWQCAQHCKLPTQEEPQAFNGKLQKWFDIDEMWAIS